MIQNRAQETKKRSIRVDKDLENDVESFRKDQHSNSWSEAARQLIVKGLRANEREKKELKYG